MSDSYRLLDQRPPISRPAHKLLIRTFALILVSVVPILVCAQSSASSTDVGLLSTRSRKMEHRQFAGPDRIATSTSEVRIIKDQPPVYLSFERAGKREPQLNGESDECIWLRLHNNTRWSIKLDTDDVPSAEFGDAGLFYEVVVDEKVVADMRCHACTTDKVPPGQSLLFSVPKEYLAKDRSL